MHCVWNAVREYVIVYKFILLCILKLLLSLQFEYSSRQVFDNNYFMDQ